MGVALHAGRSEALEYVVVVLARQWGMLDREGKEILPKSLSLWVLRTVTYGQRDIAELAISDAIGFVTARLCTR